MGAGLHRSCVVGSIHDPSNRPVPNQPSARDASARNPKRRGGTAAARPTPTCSGGLLLRPRASKTSRKPQCRTQRTHSQPRTSPRQVPCQGEHGRSMRCRQWARAWLVLGCVCAGGLLPARNNTSTCDEERGVGCEQRIRTGRKAGRGFKSGSVSMCCAWRAQGTAGRACCAWWWWCVKGPVCLYGTS